MSVSDKAIKLSQAATLYNDLRQRVEGVADDLGGLIDDTAGAGDITKVWSASKSAGEVSELKSDIDRKAPVIFRSASGDTVSFADGADGMPLSECVVSIDPVQSGTGDPAPDNVRPITGWTGANVYRTGKNMIDFPDISAPSTANTGMTFDYALPTGDYVLSFAVVGAARTSSNVTTVFWVRYADGTSYGFDTSEIKRVSDNQTMQNGLWPLTGRYYVKFTNKSLDRIVFAWRSDTYLALSDGALKNVMLERGTSATDYSAPAVQTYPVSWQTAAGTVYGGTLDLIAGKLTDMMGAKYIIDGTQTFGNVTNKVDSGGNAYTTARFALSQNAPNLSTGYVNAVCSQASVMHVYYAWQNQDIPEAGRFSVNNSNMSVSVPGTYADSTALKAYFAANPWEVVYEKATKAEYTLTDLPTVTTLKGQNNIFADCGPVTLTYPADTKTYISEATDPDGNRVTVSGSTPSIAGESGKRYVCGTLDSLTITPPSTGIIDVVFTSGTTPTVLTVPNSVKFPAWFDPASLDASTKYEINIADGVYGAVMAWQT